jgi:polyphosphate kinase 2
MPNSYEIELRDLQIELVKLQRHIIQKSLKLLIIFEGRDAAGKDGIIKCITEHLSSRDLRVVALRKPNLREDGEWYFQRYVTKLPSAGEIVLFNRSWYNRAGVERVMSFCNDKEYEQFVQTVNPFESMLIGSGIKIIKYYLDITKEEQASRLLSRKNDPLKQWKISPIDGQAQKKWLLYSKARNDMLKNTNTTESPWTIIKSNNKKLAHLNLIRDLLQKIKYPNKNAQLLEVDPRIVLSLPINSEGFPELAP